MRLREHYLRQLASLHADLEHLGRMVVGRVAAALEALDSQDRDAARRLVADDAQINQACNQLEQRVQGIIATQQPVAEDLRKLLGAIKIATELERIADYAKSIATITLRATPLPEYVPLIPLPHMAELALQSLTAALAACIAQDSTAAQQVTGIEDQIDTLETQVRMTLIEHIQRDPALAAWAVDRLIVAHILERIADRATNISEQVIFVATGEQVELNHDRTSVA